MASSSSSSENPFARLVNQGNSSSTIVARLAILEPAADPDSPIRLTLTDAPLASTSYECISYNREAEEGGTVKVLVDDAEQDIPKALEGALRIFRRRDRPRHVWADLLVGRTVAERHAQGPVMRQILSNADKTLCWLGPDRGELTSLAFDTIRDMGNLYLQACLHVGASPDTRVTEFTVEQLQGIRTRLNDVDSGALNSYNFDLWWDVMGGDVFGAKYWSSVHSIPDIVAAKLPIIVCGRSNIRWPNYIAASRAYPIFQQKFFGVPPVPPVLKGFDVANQIEVALRRKRLGQSIELFPMIQAARDCGSKDPREYVFAMLKIATPSARLQSHSQGPQPLPVIDYSKSEQQVFIEAAKYTILERQDLWVWYAECAPCQKVLKDLPTWVPDFGAAAPKGRMPSPNGGFRQWWEALQPVKPITISDDNALNVQAYGLARVAHVSPVFNAGNLSRLCYTEFEKLPDPDPEAGETAEERNERFWRTLVTNRGSFESQATLGDPGAPAASVGESFRSMMAKERILALLDCTQFELGSPSPELQARFQASPEAQFLVPLCGKGETYEALLQRYALGRRFFRTEDGRFGMTAIEDVEAVEVELSQERRRRSGSSTTGPSSSDNADGSQTEDGGGPPGLDGISRMMADPMTRTMMEAFQAHLVASNPTAGHSLSQVIRGDYPSPPQQEEQQQAPAPGVKQGVQKGDLVVALVGGFYPYMLRPCAQQTNAASAASSASASPLAMADATYEFVGDCYLHGAMDAEDFTFRNPEGKEVFRIDRRKIVDVRIV